jgi:hypothetical protein
MTTSGIPWRFATPMAEWLERSEFELLGFAERVGDLLSVEKELARVRRGKVFDVQHEPTWRMLLGAVDAIIVDLASWALGFYEKDGGGFLRKLRGPDLKALEWKLRPGEGARGVQQHWVDAELAGRRAAFDRLFPSAKLGWPCQEDIDGLCVRLEAQFKQLHDDRNHHRAHKYEHKKPKTAPRLELEDVKKYVGACQKLLADIRRLSSCSSFDAQGYRVRDDDSHARDVVDLILCGPIFWIVDFDPSQGHDAKATHYVQRREAYYERLHAAHDAAGAPEDEPFNRRAALTQANKLTETP